MYHVFSPLLFGLDPEVAHGLSLRGLHALNVCGLSRLLARPAPPLPIRVFGIDFPNPVGLAAGLDKNGEYIDALATLGFGFIEIGTVTPRPQEGNPKPRMFRLIEHEAVINRLGFNNGGVDALVANVERARYQGVLGINIGKNKDTPNERAVDDYLFCLDRVYPLADYITINISSPNTQGLRDLQQEETLRRFVETLRERQEQLASQHGQRVPMLVKIAPDLDQAALDGIAAVMLAAKVDGLICTNTTIDHSAVEGHKHAREAGGLSGRPLMKMSTAVLKAMHDRFGDELPVIGVGGISSGADAVAKVQAGASLIQCYTGLIYEGPVLVRDCIEALRGRSGRTLKST
jgi:dihydroorotate dehydrogenase